VDDTGNVTKDGKEDVDQEVCAAATLKEHTKRREDDGKNDLDDVAEKITLATTHLLALPAHPGAAPESATERVKLTIR